MKIFQFEIWLIDLNPTRGSEQKGERPCIILQTNASGDYSSTTIIAPFTTKKLNKIYPYEIVIKPSIKNGLREDSKIKLNQIRVIDKSRLIEKIGNLEENYYEDILNAIKIIFDIEQDFV